MILIAGPGETVRSLLCLMAEPRVQLGAEPVVSGEACRCSLLAAFLPTDSTAALRRIVELIQTHRPRAVVLPSIGPAKGVASGDVVLGTGIRLGGNVTAWSAPTGVLRAYAQAEAEWLANTQLGGVAGEVVNKVVRATIWSVGQEAEVGYSDDVASLATILCHGHDTPVCAFRVADGLHPQWLLWNLRSFGLSIATALDGIGAA